MAQNVKFIRGNTAKINGTSVTDGQLLYNTTTGQHYIDNESTRVEVGKPVVNTMAEVSAITVDNIPCGTKPVKELNKNLNKNLNNEINTRVNSDANLQSQINNINVTANKFQAPDYGTKTSIRGYTPDNPFYAPADGYAMLDRVYNASECIMYINWVEICRINSGKTLPGATVPGACFPVAKGDAIYFTGMPSQYSDASYYYKR